jgi:hypothetical protein
MSSKPTQKQRVVKRLKETGRITRNECLANYISRLSAIILELKKEGWDFEIVPDKKDYIYRVVKTPNETKSKYIVVGRKENGEAILELNPHYKK